MTSEEALAIVKEYMSFRDSKDFHRWIAPPVGIQTVWDAIAIVWHMANDGAPPGYHIVPDDEPLKPLNGMTQQQALAWLDGIRESRTTDHIEDSLGMVADEGIAK